MNTLSWLIYGAEILTRLASTLTFLSLFIVGASILFFIVFVASSGQNTYEEKLEYSRLSKEEKHKENQELEKSFRKLLKGIAKALAVSLLFYMMALFIPSQNTIYMIAASEVAEAGYQSELGEKVQAIIEKKVNEILEENTK